nr:protein kinase [Ornithinimicrobium sp. INDO-MA30-4]
MQLGEVITLMVPIARALEALHSAGVAHADVSPSNVLFLADGMPVLGDAGLASLAGSQSTSEFGTDGVLAPEVLEGFAATSESDIYSLGALAWWALVGEAPGWVGTRKPLNELLPTLSSAAQELIEWCLAPEPDDRPLAEEVASAAAALGVARPIDIAPHAQPSLELTRRIRGAVPLGDRHKAAGAQQGRQVPQGIGGHPRSADQRFSLASSVLPRQR